MWTWNAAAADWVIVRKDGTKIDCDGSFLVMNGQYTFQQKDGAKGSIPAADVDGPQTEAANVELISKGTKTPQGDLKFGGVSAGSPSSCTAAVEEAFQLTGVNTDIGEFAEGLQDVLGMGLGNTYSPAVAQRVAIIARAEFDSSKLLSKLEQRFVGACNMSMLQAVIAGMTSDPARKMADMEEFVDSPEGVQKRAEYIRSSRPAPVSARLDLLEKLQATRGSGEFVVDVVSAVDRAIGAKSAYSGASARKKFLDRYQSGELQKMQFTYRDATDQELAQYIELLQSRPFRDFYEGLRKGSIAVFAEQGRAARAGIDQIKASASKR
jgi:hypothetical protein